MTLFFAGGGRHPLNTPLGWAPGHRGVEGNEAASALVKEVASLILDQAKRLLNAVELYAVKKVDTKMMFHAKAGGRKLTENVKHF